MKSLLSKKVLLISMIAVLLIGTGIATTLAYLSDSKESLVNTFKLGNVTTNIEETFEKTSETTFKKEPVVENIGENDCYVRVRVTVSPEEQLEIDGWDQDNWIEKGDYYYYKKPLKANGDKTTPLFKTVSVKDEYIDTIEEFEVTVYQEAVQATMNADDGTGTSDMDAIWAAYDSGTIPETFKTNTQE